MQAAIISEELLSVYACELRFAKLPGDGSCYAGCDILPTSAQARPELPQRLDAHGARVCGDEELACCSWSATQF